MSVWVFFRFIDSYYEFSVIPEDVYYPLIDHLIDVGLRNADKNNGMVWPSPYYPQNFGLMFGDSGILYTLLMEVGHLQGQATETSRSSGQSVKL